MKIAFLADSYLYDESTNINGTQVQMYNLASAFANRGYDIHYITLTHKLNTSNPNSGTVNLHWVRIAHFPFAWVFTIRKMFEYLNEIEPDVIYQRGRSYLTFLAAFWAKRNKCRYIWGSNGEDSCDFWKNTKKVIKSHKARWKKLLLLPIQYFHDMLIHKGIQHADQVVNQTNFQKEQLKLNYGKEGIVIPSYYPPSNKIASWEKNNEVLWLANLSPSKQPERYIDLAEYCLKISNWKFIIGGGTQDKKYLESLKRKTKDIPNIEFIGAVPFDNSFEYFVQCSLLVNTSMKEADGLPNIFIQAWLAFTPVLSLNHDPNGWILQNSLGYCAHGNMYEFLKKGIELITAKEALIEMGRTCNIFANKTFCSPQIIDKYIDIYKGGNFG